MLRQGVAAAVANPLLAQLVQVILLLLRQVKEVMAGQAGVAGLAGGVLVLLERLGLLLATAGTERLPASQTPL
jgi:hypothetical protein